MCSKTQPEAGTKKHDLRKHESFYQIICDHPTFKAVIAHKKDNNISNKAKRHGQHFYSRIHYHSLEA